MLAACIGGAVVLEGQGPLKIATIAPDNSIYVKALREMAEGWKRRTNGRVTTHIYAGGDNTEEGMLRNMRPTFRKLHAAQLSSITLGHVDPAFNVFGLPMFYESVPRKPIAYLETLGPDLEKRLGARGYKVLNFAYVGWVHVFSTKPVSKVDDLKKLTLYTSTGDDRLAKWYSANGFKPVQLDATSMLTSLQTNMIEAVPSPPLFAQLLTWYKAAPHMMAIGLAPLMGSTVMSLDAWTRLTGDDQRIVAEEAKKAGERLREEVPRLEKEAIEAMKKTGLTVTAVDAAEWRRMADQVGDAMRKDGVVPEEIFALAKRERDAVRARK